MPRPAHRSMLLRAWLIAAAALLAVVPQALAAPPSVAAFFKRPALRAPKLSPNGQFLAAQAVGPTGRMWLVVFDLRVSAAPKVVAAFDDIDIYRHDWVNDDRLVLSAGNSPEGEQRVSWSVLWAVDRDGSNRKRLDADIGDARYYRAVRDGSSNVLIYRYPSEKRGLQLSRLDTRSGRVEGLSGGLPPNVNQWVVDWRGQPRAVQATTQGRARIYRREADGSWALWIEDDEVKRQHFEPYWFGTDDLTLVTAAYQGTSAVFRLDPATGKPEATPLISTPGYDYDGQLIFDTTAKRLLGVQYETDAPGTFWLDASMKAVQADIDAKLPGSVNLIGCERCVDADVLLVTSLSDRTPPRYWLYRTAARRLEPLSASRPDLPAREMGTRDVVRFKARDGLEMPLLVTQPPGPTTRRPAVVLVHGGPFVRGTHWPWEAQAQFLASRGYVVLEPEFRGSTGYGWELFRAGWKQWGLAMQNDLADAVAFADQQGWIDPRRVCIAGASYGGYAALMGAVSQGDVFKCAISWAGVTDISLMSSIHWSDLSDEWMKYGMKQLVGDPDTDGEQLRKTSPLQRAREIRMPLLVAYGDEDRRVPIKHGNDFRAALRPGQPVEWVVYSEEGHGWFNQKTNEDFWGRIERFLGKHLAAPN